jgi:transposase
MGDFARKADGRRIFTVEFTRGNVQQLAKGEKTLGEVSRELDIQPSGIREWKRRVEAAATTAVAANEDVVPASAVREAQLRIRELERLLGRKQMDVEILLAAQEVVKDSRWLRTGSAK